MSKHFQKIEERRYADYPRRYLCEYFFDARWHWTKPQSKGPCATLHSAKSHAVRAIDVFGCSVVRIFDHMKGEYVRTYKKSAHGITIHEGFVK